MFTLKKKQLMCFLVGLFALTGLFSTSALSVSALAADPPAEIDDTYKIDGITYFHSGTDKFNYPETYLQEMLGEQSALLKGNSSASTQSIADLWLRTALGIEYGCEGKRFEDMDLYPLNALQVMEAAVLSPSGHVRQVIDLTDLRSYTFDADHYGIIYQPSLKAAEKWVFSNCSRDEYKDSAVFDDDISGETQHVLVDMVEGISDDLSYLTGDKLGIVAAVYYTDFEIVTVLPEDNGKNYVSEISKNTVGKTTASNVKNLTASTVSTSQSLTQSHTASVNSSVSGSNSYSFSEGFSIGTKNSTSIFGLFNTELTTSFNFSATEAISKGWSKGESESDSDSVTQAVSVTLPPFTNVMLTQKKTTAEQVTAYNCPVGLKYNATVVLYSLTNPTFSITTRSHTYSFGKDSRKELNKWAIDLPTVANPQALNWAEIKEKMSGVADAVETVSSHVPMASTGAKFTTRLETMENEVSGIMPVYSLSAVKVTAPNISFINSGVSYDGYNYLTANMKVGDSSFTNYLTLTGYNNKGGEYYGFRKNAGTWIVLDEEGKILVDEKGKVHGDPPVTLKRDSISGNTRYTAVKPGRCYLKFLINEDLYSTASEPDRFTTNADLKGNTAVLEIVVSSGCKDNEHKWNGGVNTTQATCEKTGVKTYTCEVCGKTRTEKTAALGHKWSEWEVAIAATEKEKGKETRYCLNDPSHTQTRIIPELSHKHTLVRKKKKAATCTKNGIRAYYYCKTCKKLFLDARGRREIDKEDTVILKLDHKWSSGDVTKEPTCKKTGKKVYTCLRCGKKKTKKLKALGHTWSSWQIKESPTTEAAGLKIRFCLNDPSHVQKKVIPKLAKGKRSETNHGGTSGNTDTQENGGSGNNSNTAKANSFFFAYPAKISANEVTLKWNRVDNVQRYVVFGAKCGENMKEISTVDPSVHTWQIHNISGNDLKKDVYYKFYVAAYGYDSNGNSGWIGNTPALHLVLNGSSELGNFDHIQLNSESTITISQGGTTVIKAEQKKAANEKKTVPKHRRVVYLSTDTKIARVNKTSGKVTGVSKGTCEIYCISQNGLYQVVKIHVK